MAQEKLSLINNDYTVALQEKAIIQGQFIQLQASL